MAPVTAGSVIFNTNGNISNKKITVYHGTFVDTPNLGEIRVRPRASIGVEECSGVILFIVADSNDPIKDALEFDPTLKSDDIQLVNISNCSEDGKKGTKFFFPGFIDTHIHASQYPNCGIFGKSSLLDWLESYTFPLESSLKDSALAELVYEKLISQSLKHGTTCASYYTTIDSSSSRIMARLCSQKGQRAFVGKVCMNENSPEYYREKLSVCKDSSVELIQFIEEILLDPKIKPIVTPRFAVACSSKMMKWLSELAYEYELPIQTHLSENLNEIKLVKQLFPDCESYTDVYHQHGLLNEKTVLAHCVHLTEDEIRLLKQQNCGISHCPISNSSLTSGECRIKHLLKNGLKIGLGSDVSGGYSVSILENARQAIAVSRHLAMSFDDNELRESNKLSVADVLYLATLGGAEVMNLEGKVGSFEVGKEFDSQFINLNVENSRVDVFPWQEVDWSQKSDDEQNRIRFEDLIAKWVFNGDDRNLTHLWIAGKICHQTSVIS